MNPDTHQKWMDAITSHLKKGKSTTNLYVCEKHFDSDDVEKDYVTVLPDGTVNKIPRSSPFLKKSAVPRIFYADNEIEDTSLESAMQPEIEETSLRQQDSTNTNNAGNQDGSQVDNLNDESPKYTFHNLEHDLIANDLSGGWGASVMDNRLLLVQIPSVGIPIMVFIDQQMNATIHTLDVVINNTLTHISSYEDFCSYLKSLLEKTPCVGIGDIITRRHEQCEKLVQSSSTGVNLTERCDNCKHIRRNEKESERRKSQRSESRKRKYGKTFHNIKQKCSRLEVKNAKLNTELDQMMVKYDTLNEQGFMAQVQKLPNTMQEQVTACFVAAKTKGKKGRRYSTEWMYECFLLRVKGRASYEHLRKEDILPLPTIQTINKYIKKMKPIYGFDETIFDCLQAKTENFSDSERHGVLLIDEIKISEAVVFDKETLKYIGFTDLGTHTQEKDVNRRGDHALVLMYQPFRGNWIQTVGAFLSRGCATGPILHKITLEALVLIEKTGLLVDGIVTDGASWNRNMWKCFGIEKAQTTCIHPCDNNRSLYFFSDFPHLIKCLRNFIVSCSETWTPDGIIKLNHWESIVDQENRKYVLKIAYKLTKNHIHPEFHQKMNVPMAFELFSKRTRAAMELLKDEREELADCNSTINFTRRVDDLILAMMSRTSLNSLSINSNPYKVISDFLDYIYEWEEHALEKGYKFLSQGTCHGFKVTLKNTLNLLDYLSTTCNYEYLMTSRLNQDALESFFGMVRNACGSNDHPDSTTFIQVYRLLSLFSLVKPPRGSNVNGVDIFNIILEQKSPPVAKEPPTMTWEQTIDSVIETSKSGSEEPRQYNVIEDHNYTIGKSMEVVESYMAGYVIKKMTKKLPCDECYKSVSDEKNKLEDRNRMINVLSEGYLIYPSTTMLRLIEIIEKHVMAVTSTGEFCTSTFIEITEKLSKEEIPLVGCSEHNVLYTRTAVSFYLLCRAHFIAHEFNKLSNTKKEKVRALRKQAKFN